MFDNSDFDCGKPEESYKNLSVLCLIHPAKTDKWAIEVDETMGTRICQR